MKLEPYTCPGCRFVQDDLLVVSTHFLADTDDGWVVHRCPGCGYLLNDALGTIVGRLEE